MRPIYSLSVSLLILLFASCNDSMRVKLDSPDNQRLNTLFTYEQGENILFMQDYILDLSSLDSVSSASTELELSLTRDKKQLTLIVPEDGPSFVDLILWTSDGKFAIPCRRSDKVPYIFTFKPGTANYQRVQIAGQMNDWTPSFSPDLKQNEDGSFEIRLMLNPGRYEYQLVLDGKQQQDPSNPDFVIGGTGNRNSFFKVGDHYAEYPQLMTLSHEGEKIKLKATHVTGKIHAYWQNMLLSENRVKLDKGVITLDIPTVATKLERSFLRVWADNEFGCSNDILVPLQHGKVLDDAKEITRADHRAMIMYFLLVDRFKNGNTSNDAPLNRPDVNSKVDFWGGDIAGISQELENGYFDSLGVNSLWISPLNQNPEEPFGYYAFNGTKFSGYHGYWPVSSSKVDHRFGTSTELKDMISKSHDHGISILLDYVANHVHEQHPLYKQHPEYATNLYLPDGSMNVQKWDEQRLTTWFDTFMPSLDFSNPDVVEMMTDSALFWMKEFGLDGFRHDACKHINLEFWRTLTYKMKKAFPNVQPYQIGETYGSPGLISSYLTTGMLDGQFDFNVYDVANNSFAGLQKVPLTDLKNTLQSSLRTYGVHNLMGNISGNHDKPRFMAYASGDLKPGEDSKLAGWVRKVGVSDSTAYDKMFLFQAFNLTITGIPVIFYGDEIGMTGANDPDCRRMMRFENWNSRERKLWKKISVMAHLRKNNPVLVYGDFINLITDQDSWAYARKYFEKTAIMVFNNSSAVRVLQIPVPEDLNVNSLNAVFGTKFQIKNKILTIQLLPYSMETLMQ